jgi:hypothetical protein
MRDRERVDSTDVIVLENDDVIFVEIVAKRLQLVESALRLQPKSIEDDIRRGLLRKARQLHHNIMDFRSGVLLPEWPRHHGQRLFPIIVSPRYWPRIQILTRYWPDEQQREGLLLDAEPLEILNADEVELLAPMLASGLRLVELLDLKNRPPRSHESSRMQTMHDYLAITEPGLIVKESIARTRGNQIASELMTLVASWAK